jgi:hypothetical protein
LIPPQRHSTSGKPAAKIPVNGSKTPREDGRGPKFAGNSPSTLAEIGLVGSARSDMFGQCHNLYLAWVETKHTKWIFTIHVSMETKSGT